MKRIISALIAVTLIIFTAACVSAAETAQLTAENGKITVTNAVDNGTLILAFYDDEMLVGASIYRGSGIITADISNAPENATDFKAFYWDMKDITPLGNIISLTIGSIPTETPKEPPTQSRALTVYFSCTGNTKDLAEKVANAAGTDLYEIEPEIPYTSDDLNYHAGDCRANREMRDINSRPAISGSIENISDYDTIILGYPIWGGNIPRIINTFLESYDFSEKTIIPFCTSNTTGISGSVSTIRNAYPDITVTDGFRGTGSTTADQIKKWLTDSGLEINTEKPTEEPTTGPKKPIRAELDGAQIQTDNPNMATRVLESGTKINMHFGDTVIPGLLNDSDTAKALIEKLPYTVHVSSYSHDFCGVMQDRLPYNENEVYPGWLNGDIDYEISAPYFTVLYSDEENSDRFSGLVNIGVITCELSEIRNLSGDYDVLIELVEETEDTPEMKMNVRIGNTSFTAALEDNAATRELVEMMKEAPVSVNMSDYGSFEKVGSLGRSLTTDNHQITAKAGDIVLYQGNQIVMFYGSNSWSYTKIGRIDDLTGWREALGSGSITAVFSLKE